MRLGAGFEDVGIDHLHRHDSVTPICADHRCTLIHEEPANPRATPLVPPEHAAARRRWWAIAAHRIQAEFAPNRTEGQVCQGSVDGVGADGFWSNTSDAG